MSDVKLIAAAALAAVASIVATAALLALLVGCSPATTRRLCDTSEVVIEVARPSTPNGELGAQIARFVRGLFCPRS